MPEDQGYYPDPLPLPDFPEPGEQSFPEPMAMPEVDGHGFPEPLALPDMPDAESGAFPELMPMPEVETQEFPEPMPLPDVGTTSDAGAASGGGDREVVQALASIQQTLMEIQASLERIAEL